MKELSIFVDESGDFGVGGDGMAQYLVTMVFHDQSKDISAAVSKLNNSLRSSGLGIEYIHTGPIIRREEVFAGMSIDERRKLVYKMLNFFNSIDIHHCTVSVDRKEAQDKVSLSGRLAKAIKKILDDHESFFRAYDKIIVYYDNGQAELSSILNAVFSLCFSDVSFRKADPREYKLLQVADFVCSMALLEIKRDENRLSSSETRFFYKPQELKKTFLKSVRKKRL